ncbi:MAG: aldo/keto reductase [Rhodobiaceae bacterium]|nr:aldo/keto reductase [Rhodobiaceae bacterium]MCC0057309.1 aldo/keto reductase [Rhodobiaceae bacterium]
MEKRNLGKTDLTVAPIVLGGNVFGWTIDEKESFAVLDAFIDQGFNAIDTADSYSRWVPGHKGGESETIIGKWLKARPGMRDRVVIFTKVASDLGGDRKGLSARWIAQAAEDSLSRLGIEKIDLYFSHWFDPDTPFQETLEAYDRLIRAGKVGVIGASNHDATQLEDALRVSVKHGLPLYQALQPGYNLYSRMPFEGPLRDLCIRENLGVVPYFALAAGFLTGKYRSKADLGKSARGAGVEKYLDDRGIAILDALQTAANRHGATQAEIALAWLMAQPGITAPIASATSIGHVDSFARAATLKLDPDDLELLDGASR